MRLLDDEAICVNRGGDEDDEEEDDGGGGCGDDEEEDGGGGGCGDDEEEDGGDGGCGDDDDDEETAGTLAGTSASTRTGKKPFQRGPTKLPEHLPRPEDRAQIVISGPS